MSNDTLSVERILEIASELDQTAGKGYGKNFILKPSDVVELVRRAFAAIEAAQVEQPTLPLTDATTMQQDEREAFEAWRKTILGWEVMPEGYGYPAWSAWQARALLSAAPPAPSLYKHQTQGNAPSLYRGQTKAISSEQAAPAPQQRVPCPSCDDTMPAGMDECQQCADFFSQKSQRCMEIGCGSTTPGAHHETCPEHIVGEQAQPSTNLLQAVENFIKVKGRHHTEQAYQRLVSAFEQVRGK